MRTIVRAVAALVVMAGILGVVTFAGNGDALMTLASAGIAGVACVALVATLKD